MGYPISGQTFHYETILNMLKDYPKGVSVSQLKKKYPVLKRYDIKGAITWKGSTKQARCGEEPHFITDMINRTNCRYKITPAGRQHLKDFADLIQKDVQNLPVYYKDGYDENGNPDGSEKQVRGKNKPTQQELIPVEEPIQLSAASTLASELFHDVLVSNHAAKTCVEEVHCTIGKFLEENPANKFDELQDGLLASVLEEIDLFRDALEKSHKLTTKVLTSTTTEPT